VGDPTTHRVERFEPTENEAASSKLYRIPAKAMMQVGRRAEDEGLDLIGVVHSHTHTTAYPSPTDVRDAELLGHWHFVIVSLRDEAPVLRSFRIVDEVVTEEQVVVEG
jgi:proteasome lid subunit RPN8/RPN11